MKILKMVLTIIVSILVFILIAIFLWFAVWNSVKFAVFSDFYNIQHSVTKIPGINDNFVPQGITVTDEYYITSGYMSTDEASRIYHTDTDDALPDDDLEDLVVIDVDDAEANS